MTDQPIDLSSLVDCPYCGARAGHQCRVRHAGWPTKTHAARKVTLPPDPEAERLARQYYERQRSGRKLTPAEEAELADLVARAERRGD